jgi:hypothetical protein
LQNSNIIFQKKKKSGPLPVDFFFRLKFYLGSYVVNNLLFTGFIGVYLVGYILEVTGSWSAVFNVTAVINLIGLSVFALFGSGNPIV